MPLRHPNGMGAQKKNFVPHSFIRHAIPKKQLCIGPHAPHEGKGDEQDAELLFERNKHNNKGAEVHWNSKEGEKKSAWTIR